MLAFVSFAEKKALMQDKRKILEEARKEAAELRKLLEQVNADIAECNRHMSKEDSPFWRRAAFRTVFASMEALVAHAKRSVLVFSKLDGTALSPAEYLALRGVEYAVEENGAVVERKAKIRFLADLHLALSYFAKATESDLSLKKDDGWVSLTRSVKVRDRITHPKTAEDYDITDPEVKELLAAWAWFGTALVHSTVKKKKPQGS